MENLCLPIIWGFEICYKIVESCVPDAIQAFVDFAGPPEEYCYLLFLCPDKPTTPLPLNWVPVTYFLGNYKHWKMNAVFVFGFLLFLIIALMIRRTKLDCMKVCQGKLAWQLATHRMWVSSSGSTACHYPTKQHISWLQNKTKKRNQTVVVFQTYSNVNPIWAIDN